MIKHVVCFKLNDSSETSKNEVKEMLLSMVGNVPEIKDIEVGTDFLCSEKSYDVILQVTVDGKEELDSYQNNKYHVEVVKAYIRSRAVASIVVDYEI